MAGPNVCAFLDFFAREADGISVNGESAMGKYLRLNININII